MPSAADRALPGDMLSAWYDRTGPADEVLEVGRLPVPEPGAGEVLVRLHASAVNPSDVKRRAGWRAKGPLAGRVIPHSDGAGVIAAAGAGVDPAWAGRRVWLYNAQGALSYGGDGPETGTAAEYVVMPVGLVVPLPDAAGFDAGACLGIPACTAHRAVFADGPVAGQTLLVQGGAGAVGELAIQFAAAAGARVIAVVSSPEKAAVAEAAGAFLTVNRREPELVEAVRAAAPDGVDRVVEVDFGANIATDLAVLRRDGIIATYSSTSAPEPAIPYYPLQHRGAVIRFVASFHLPAAARAQAIADIARMLAAGTLRPTIAARLPLDKIAEAHLLKESGRSVGNVIVTSA